MTRADYSARRHKADLNVDVSAQVTGNTYLAGNLITQGAVSHNLQKVMDVGEPAAATDAATKGYADNPAAAPWTLAPAGTWTISSQTCQVKAGWVSLRLAVSKPSGTTANGEQFAFLPAALRPASEAWGTAFGAAATGGGMKSYLVSIHPAGTIHWRGSAYPAASESVTVIATYPIA